MSLSIPRGIVYHTLGQDIGALFSATFAPLDDTGTVRSFEAAFATYQGREHCVAFPFARVAIYEALRARAIAPGSEIIMPPITIKAMLDVVLELGLVPVFVDLDPETLCFSEEALQEAITDKTKAILITYLFGMVPRVAEMVAMCRERGIFVLEDFSQCLNGRYDDQKVGSFGDVGIYSASSIKTLDTYGGGLLVCDDGALVEKLRTAQAALQPPSRVLLIKKIATDLARNLATRRFVFHFGTFPLIKLMGWLKPGSTMKHTGGRNQEMVDQLPKWWFERYTSFQARLGMKLLPGVAESDGQRISNVRTLQHKAPAVRFPQGVDSGSSVYWQLVGYFDKPSEATGSLGARGVDTSTTSLEKISNLAAYPVKGVTPNADRLYSNGLLIPAYPRLSDQDVARVADALGDVSSR